MQDPDESNGQIALAHATVETARYTFSGIDDASPANISQQTLTVRIRLSETRAKARALQDAVNAGVAVLEELGGVNDSRDDPPPPATVAPRSKTAAVHTSEAPATESQLCAIARLGGTVKGKLSDAQAALTIRQLQMKQQLEGVAS